MADDTQYVYVYVGDNEFLVPLDKMDELKEWLHENGLLVDVVEEVDIPEFLPDDIG